MELIESNNIIAILYGLFILLVMVLSCQLMASCSRNAAATIRKEPGRNVGIDGLRGILATAVFVHHSFTAAVYFKTGEWTLSEKSAALNQFGSSGVALFFFITAFLFVERIANSENIDWIRIYTSRFFRLTPLYLIYVFAVVIYVFTFGGLTIREPVSQIFFEILHWATFCMVERPDINQVKQTWIYSAGVNWSLRYEWFFYFSLPVFFLFLHRVRSRQARLLGLGIFFLALTVMAIKRVSLPAPVIYTLHFLCGASVAIAYRDPLIAPLISSKTFQIASSASILLLLFFRSSGSIFTVLICMFFFFGIVSMNRGGKIFTNRGIRFLGEISYGVYLLHGLVLYAALFYINEHIGFEKLGGFLYALIAAGLGALVVMTSAFLHFFVELPGISIGRKIGESISNAVKRRDISAAKAHK